MDPAVRQQWAATWARWLQPGGQLVTLMFPVEPEGREGPPWPVPLELYQNLLPPQGRDKRVADARMFPVELENRKACFLLNQKAGRALLGLFHLSSIKICCHRKAGTGVLQMHACFL